MIGDLYIYSDTFNGDVNIVDLSSNNFTITKKGLPYHSTSYTSILPRMTSAIVIPYAAGFSVDTNYTLGDDADFTFDIYINYVLGKDYNNYTFAKLGYIEIQSRASSSYVPNFINIVNGRDASNIYSNIAAPCLLTITRQSNILKIFRNGVLLAILNNFDIGESFLEIENRGNVCVINTIRVINGTGLYNTDFTMPTFPYTDGENITGQVTENDIGVIRTIRLYNRNNGLLTYTTVSNADGSYEIPILNNDVEYDVVFLDDTAGYTYNDIIKRTSLI